MQWEWTEKGMIQYFVSNVWSSSSNISSSKREGKIVYSSQNKKVFMQFGDFMHSSTLFGIIFFCVATWRLVCFLLSISRCLVTRSAQISEKKMTIWINFLHIYSLSNTFMNKNFIWFYRHILIFKFYNCASNFTTPLCKYVMCRLQKNVLHPAKCTLDE